MYWRFFSTWRGIFLEPGSFTFLVEAETDCNYELIINIEPESEEICNFENCKVYIPNVFSPDNDGVNDVFQPFSTNVTFNEMLVCDRWGNKIFESTALNPAWDGTYKGQSLLPAVYVYVLQGVCRNGEQVLFADDITLLRWRYLSPHHRQNLFFWSL